MKKWWKDVLLLAALTTLICVPLSSIFPVSKFCAEHRLLFYELSFRVMRCMLVAGAIGSLFEHIITEFELFSTNKWIRRAIIIMIAIFLAIISIWVCIRRGVPAFPRGLLLGSLIFLGAVGAILSVVGYFLEDKRRKKEIADINERLNTLNSK